MRVRSVNYWMNQISAERKNTNTKEPQSSKDLNYQTAKYYVSKSNSNQSKVA